MLKSGRPREVRRRDCCAKPSLTTRTAARPGDRAQLADQRAQRREHHLGAPGFDERRGAAERLLFELVARLEVVPAAFEAGDGAAHGVALRRQADGRERVERLQHDDRVVGPQALVHEPCDRVANARRVGSVDVELVEQDRDPPRLRPARLHRGQLLHDAVFAQLEVFQGQAGHRFAGPVGHRRRDAHGLGRRSIGEEGDGNQQADERMVQAHRGPAIDPTPV